MQFTKTPQEKAEELVCYAENLIAQRRPNYNNLPIMDREVAKAIILTEIPLAELIAVARAAARIGGERIEFEGSEHYAVVIEEVDELDNALQALRATGKVEL